MIMNDVVERVRIKDRRGRAGVTVILGVSLAVLSGCSDILQVDLPAQLGDAALTDPTGAEFQVATFIGHYENGIDDILYEIHGREDVGEASVGGANRGDFQYEVEAGNFNNFSVSRSFAYGLHDKLTDEWTVAEVAKRSEYLAISSMYAGANLSWMGSALCEATVDGGAMMTAAQTLTLAETWLTQSLGEIASAGGDFEMPYGIASSAKAQAYGLRAQTRWMAGDLAGASADAAQVPQGFYAYVTREDTPDRDNTTWFQAVSFQSSIMYDVNDWWVGPVNPVTGQAWGDPIAFTGWINLGILPDGRAVREDGLPIRTAVGLVTDHPPTADELANAVADTRAPTFWSELILGYGTGHVMNRYTGGGADIPMVNWKEMVLIRAEHEGGQAAIDYVNVLRTADNLPLVTYADPTNATQIKYMIIEERRRALYLEGRYFFTKIKNTDLLWFPRNVGAMMIAGNPYYGGVRYIMPRAEFEVNKNLNLDKRGTGCDAGEAPTIL